jgi:dihydrofolate reductase
VISTRRLFDVVDGPKGWNDDVGYGVGEAGLPDAVATARERAEAASSHRGEDLDVVLMGGATVGAALGAGLVDELRLHLAPVVLGAGTPLFSGGAPRTLVQRSVISTSTATHLTYDVVAGQATSAHGCS